MSQEVVKYEPSQPVGTVGTLQALLESPKMQLSLHGIASKVLDPKRLLKMILLAVNRQPALLKCTQSSLLEATMTAAELGVDCSGTLGGGYLVPYGQKATFILGYRGLIDLARRGGDVQSITAHVVYKNDKFKLVQGLEEKLEHEPNLDAEHKDDEITGAYMIARFKDGGHHIEYMNIKEILAIKKRSKAGDSGPWRTDFAEMVRKTVVRRGAKYLPLSIDAVQAISQSDEGLLDTWIPPAPETGSLSLNDFSEKPQEPIDVEPSMPRNEGEPQPDFDLGSDKQPHLLVQRMFFARCDGKNYTEVQRDEARAAMFAFLMVEDWPEIQTDTQVATAKDWINKMLKVGKK